MNMSATGPATRAAKELIQMTVIPASFNGNVFLYTAALISVMCIACLGASVAGWMGKDLYCDREVSRRGNLLFNFRVMMMLCGFAAFLRAAPEVLYLQVFNDPDVSLEVQGGITTAKRIADTFSLWFVLAWMLILTMIYPSVCTALKTGPAKFVEVSVQSALPRLIRPTICFICIVLVSIAFAYAKVYRD